MIAWFGEKVLKDAAMDRLHEHKRLEEIVQRVYWDHGKGCNLGCLTHCQGEVHQATVRMFGIELPVAYFLETIFEGLSPLLAPQWVIDSAEAIPVGADLSKWHHRFGAWLLRDSGLWKRIPWNASMIDCVLGYHQRCLLSEDQEVADLAVLNSFLAGGINWDMTHPRMSSWETVWAVQAAQLTAEEGMESEAVARAYDVIAAKALELFRASPIGGACEECPQAAAASLAQVRSVVQPIGVLP